MEQKLKDKCAKSRKERTLPWCYTPISFLIVQVSIIYSFKKSLYYIILSLENCPFLLIIGSIKISLTCV